MTITLITGANRSLGLETAKRLRDAGHTVLLAARDETAGRRAAEDLGVAFVQLDVTDDASVAAAAESVRTSHGRLDVLINNAGVTEPRLPARDMTADAAGGAFDANVLGPIRTMHAFLPLLDASDDPRIINVASGLGSVARVLDPSTVESKAPTPVYSATKAALVMLTVRYAQQLTDVRIVAVDPGYTATDFNGHSGHQSVEEGTDEVVRLATEPRGAASGTFTDRFGTVPW